jgi:hypothetical protein
MWLENSKYLTFGGVIGLFLVAPVVFIGCWIYCIANYGFLLGVGFGWLPSAIVAAFAFGLAMILWPMLFLGVAGIAYFLIAHIV